MQTFKTNFFTQLKQNWKSALTVALVSIPLSISIAIASGASPLNGIITAVWGGLIAALFSASKFNIVGPAGALTAILAAAALQFGPAALSSIAIIAGIIIIIAWALRLDKYITYIPSSVIHGFTLSVAIVIGFNQLNFAFGLTNLTKHAGFLSNVLETFSHIQLASPAITGFFIFSLAFLFAMLKFFPKLPGAVLLAPIAIAVGYFAQKGSLPFDLITLGEVFPNLKLSIFSIPDLVFANSYVLPAATVALVAILETILSAKIADRMTKTKHDQRKEILGLGLANIGSGFFGGLPATGVFVRTSLNVRSGATSKMSQGMNALMVAIISIVLLSAFNYMPMAGIAAILIFAAIRMVEVKHFKRLYACDKTAFAVAIIVAAISVYEDAMIGILVGTTISLIILIERMSKGQFELVVNKDKKIINRIIGGEADHKLEIAPDAHVCVYSIKGHLTYANAHVHVHRIEKTLFGCNIIVLRLRELVYVDVDGIEALDDILAAISKKGGRAIITGISPLIAKQLKHSHDFTRIVESGDVFDRSHQALNALGYELSGNN
ncbi:MAG: SulP family inorganic anion transporter [Patescibacteria group bacterium]